MPHYDRFAASWSTVCNAFENGAESYKRTFGRPPTLVIDGADFMMQYNESLVKVLLARAKALARPPFCLRECRARMLPTSPCVLGCHLDSLVSKP